MYPDFRCKQAAKIVETDEKETDKSKSPTQ